MTQETPAPAPDADALEVFDQVAGQIAQVRVLSFALQTILKAEREAPLQGDQSRALAIAIERATDDTASLFEAYYHPISAS